MHEAAAALLRDAYAGGQIAPLRDALTPNDGEGAYAVQSINIEYWKQSGRRLIGRKVGLTAKAVQQQLGVDQPDFGALFEDMQLTDGAFMGWDGLLQPKAEAEVALVMAHDLPPGEIDRATFDAAVAHAVAAIEIVDSRIADWKITFADTVADNGSSAKFVLGPDRHPLADLDLESCAMVMEINDAVVSSGVGAACLGHPLNAGLWLANTLAARGEPLRCGDIVLTGALGPMVALQPGDRVRATIGGLGAVGFTCADAR